MSDKLKHIDELYRKGLETLEAEASGRVWRKLGLKLFLWKYGRIILISSIAGLTVIAGYLARDTHTGSVNEQAIIQPVTVAADTAGTERSDARENVATGNEFLPGENRPAEEKTGLRSAEIKEAAKEAVPRQNKPDTEGAKPSTFSGLQHETANMKEPESGLSEREVAGDPKNRSTIESREIMFIDRVYGRSGSLSGFIAGRTCILDALSAGDTVPLSLFDPNDLKKYLRLTSVEFFASPFYSGKELTGDSHFNEVIAIREDGEHPQISFAAGAALNLRKRNWFVKAGLNYRQYNEKIDYNIMRSHIDSLASFYERDTIFGWVFDPPNIGQEIVLGFDSVFMASYYQEIRRFNARNRIAFIEIPFLGGYVVEKGRFGMEFAGGLSLGIPVKTSGLLYTDDDVVTVLEKCDPLYNTTVSLIIQTGFLWDQGDRFTFSLQPWYRRQLNSSFKGYMPLEQRMWSAGINAAIGIKLVNYRSFHADFHR
ncbi:MAG: hypothetical protein JXA03_04105 [Bacteroidales bacterium]|nr:hypothetical protein [Bacteroidales bacterium]